MKGLMTDMGYKVDGSGPAQGRSQDVSEGGGGKVRFGLLVRRGEVALYTAYPHHLPIGCLYLRGWETQVIIDGDVVIVCIK